MNSEKLVHQKIIIVSISRRSVWLAYALKSFGFDVTFIDITSLFSRWPIEDLKGPFGFFKNEKLAFDFIHSIYAGDPCREVSNGFTAWDEEGVVEFKGPLAQYHKDVGRLDFLDKLSFYLGKTHVNPLICSQTKSSIDAQSFFQTHEVFTYTKDTHHGVKKFLEDCGVQYVDNANILDLVVGDKIGIELRGETITGYHEFDHLIWSLNSEETYLTFSNFAKKLYKKQFSPIYNWSRYRFQFQVQEDILRQIPASLVLIQDQKSHWVNENLILLVRTALADVFDVWILTSYEQIHSKNYHDRIYKHIVDHLSIKMPFSQFVIQSFPQEYYYSKAELNSSRFPVFKLNEIKLKPMSNNIHINSPETWNSYYLNDVYNRELSIYNNIHERWNVLNIKENKKRKRK